jgi:hypothetical protein
MRSHLVVVALVALVTLVGCAADDGGSAGPDGAAGCPLDESIAAVGAQPALKAQRCNVPGSMGARKWYRLSATLPGTTDVVQLELYDQAGPFAGGAVHTGTFPIETDVATCGVCLRAVGDKGAPTETAYFGTGGTVNITAIGTDGAPISAALNDATLVEVDANQAPVSGGCTTSIASLQIDGTVMEVGGSGGGGGGGTGGSGSCATTVGD